MSEHTFMKAVKSTEKTPDKQNNMIKSNNGINAK